MKDSKNLVIGMLCAVVCIMAVAYAAFQTQLTVNGTTTIASEWNVEITNIDCTEDAAVDYEATTASFAMNLSDTHLSETCTVTITNSGNLAAKVAPNGLVITGEGEDADKNIVFEVDDTNIVDGSELAPGASKTFTVTGTYVMDADGDDVPDFIPENHKKDVTVTVTYEQDFSK